MFSPVDQELGPILGGARVQSVCAVSAWDGSCGVLCAEERELACVPRSPWMRGSSCCELRGLGRFGTSGAAVGGQCGGCVCAAATCSEGCFMGLFAAQTGCGSSPKSAWIRRTRGYPGFSPVDQELGLILGGALVQSAWDGLCGVLCAEERELA